MPKKCRSVRLTRWIPLAILAVLSILFWQGISAEAAPPEGPALGITPTPTSTTPPPPTPTRRPSGPSPGKPDPVITKRSEPSEARPGQEASFILHVTNVGKHAAVDVVVTDEISEYLEILDVTTTQGTVTIEGQRITVEVGTVGPDFVVEIVIRVRVREDTPAPLEIGNLAILKSPNSGDRTASASISVPRPVLPVTGRSENAGAVLWIAVSGLAAVTLLGIWESIRSQSRDRAP